MALVASHALGYVLWILSWWLLGRGALEGRLDRGWLLAWGLILLTLIPFRLLASYAGGLLSVRAGALLKRRLLYGALRMEAEEVRFEEHRTDDAELVLVGYGIVSRILRSVVDAVAAQVLLEDWLANSGTG